MERRAQIVMRAKHLPRLHGTALDREIDLGSPLKLPPLEAVEMRLIHPIRLEPLLDVVVARHRHKPLTATPHCLRDRGTPNLRHRPIYH